MNNICFVNNKLSIDAQIHFRVTAYHPSERIGEKQILSGIGETFVTVAHVQVDHAVVLVSPDDREVAPFHDVLDAEGIHLR